MDKLWAPWRSRFVKARKKKGCIFCMGKRKDKNAFIVKKTKFSFALLNIYPYNNGHVMVSPCRHVKDLKGLTDKELLDIMKLVRDMQVLLEKRLKPHGFNIGINMGKVAGAGYKDHVHIHIVPRWRGDVNFMPVTGNTKVIPQSLEELRKLLTK
ncbi:MAG: HIT domain-containing protein [Candidatus Omnitrophica bacterium]|nr:HIT domain-containing protein [Candidatus Omnitrophota bacterium]MBU4590468.1 HIT domain-containing protein [Candidatus Omnitrophota bacterium]